MNNIHIMDVEKLIECVRRRPALYDPTVSGYRNRASKQGLWMEICKEMAPQEKVDELSFVEEQQLVKAVQERWKNLRTCFKRDLNLMQREGEKRKYRRYRYFDQLSFLIAVTEDSVEQENEFDEELLLTDSDNHLTGVSDEGDRKADLTEELSPGTYQIEEATFEIEDVKPSTSLLASVNVNANANESTSLAIGTSSDRGRGPFDCVLGGDRCMRRRRGSRKRRRERASIVIAPVPEKVEEVEEESTCSDVPLAAKGKCRQAEYIDEDKSFLLSLVPTFRRFDDERKYRAKIEFLKVLRDIQLG